MTVPITITADEVNCLIHAYFQDSGFQHSAFTLRMEGRLDHSHHIKKHIPRGELLELLSKALLYSEVEAHWKGDGLAANCKNGFSLLEHHVCSFDANESLVQTVQPNEESTSLNVVPDAGRKRKSITPSSEDGCVKKRARREVEDAESVIVIDGVPVATPKELKSSTNDQLPSEEKRSTKHTVPASGVPKSHAVRVLRAHKAEVFVVSWNPVTTGRLVSGSRDAMVIYWDVPTTQQENTPLLPMKKLTLTNSQSADVTSLDWSQDGSLVAIGTCDPVLRICDASGTIYMTDQHHKAGIYAVKFSPSCQWVATASMDGTSCIWDVKNRKLHRQYRNREAPCLDLEWLDDSTFANCGNDYVVNIISLDGTEPIRKLSGHTGELTMIKCNASRTRLASSSDDATARIWDMENIRSERMLPAPVVLKGHAKWLTCVKWCPNTAPGTHERIATISFDQTARLWDSVTGDCLRIFCDHVKSAYSLAFSPDGHQLVTGGADGALYMYDIEEGGKVWSWSSGLRSGIFDIDWKRWGETSLIALAAENHTVVVVDTTKMPVQT